MISLSDRRRGGREGADFSLFTTAFRVASPIPLPLLPRRGDNVCNVHLRRAVYVVRGLKYLSSSFLPINCNGRFIRREARSSNSDSWQCHFSHTAFCCASCPSSILLLHLPGGNEGWLRSHATVIIVSQEVRPITQTHLDVCVTTLSQK